MNEIIFFIREVGFPIGISIYLIVVFNKSLSDNTKAITELTSMVRLLCEREKIDMSGRGKNVSDTKNLL